MVEPVNFIPGPQVAIDIKTGNRQHTVGNTVQPDRKSSKANKRYVTGTDMPLVQPGLVLFVLTPVMAFSPGLALNGPARF